ncbi:MAG TPA: hypothetical protein VJ813_14760, partial [Vicinamibacterales bacterium]|nr:hypothetical protein [Vicinamibacterales bacterium]
MRSRPVTLGQLRQAVAAGTVKHRPVKEEIRDNLISRLRAGGTLFPGIIGYDDSVVPQIVNAVLSQHNFILLGLRGQAKSRILRALANLLDDEIAVMPGCEIHDDPLAPLCAACRARLRDEGESIEIAWLPREARYVEKLATPDVTIADIIGDLDPIKAARAKLHLADELTMHYGLLPRANRGIFAINELPDLAGKIQVGLFNILQEGDVQIKGYPVRLPLDVLMVFSANPEDYTARGKIITPLKDRIGSEIRTHYPATRHEGMAITAQEAWTHRRGLDLEVPGFVREIVEEVAFQARQDSRVDKRSGVSQRLPISLLENVVSNAERRAVLAKEPMVVPRVSDVYAALPAITGKFELEYEGELRGADNVAREIIRNAVGAVFGGVFASADYGPVGEWFELGGTLQVEDTLPADDLLKRTAVVQGLHELAQSGLGAGASKPLLAAAV